MREPHVSICIPTYDRPDRVGVAIRSVLDQSFDDVEVVVSDNHTSAREIVQGIGDERVRYFANAHNLGLRKNFQLALDRSRGQLIGVLCDDDKLLPGYLDRVVSAFEERPKLGVVFTDHFLDDGTRIVRRGCRLAGGHYEEFLEPLLEHLPLTTSSVLMRREVWSETRPLPNLITPEYVIFIRAAIAHWSFQYIDDPLMIYAVHPEQLSNTGHQIREDFVEFWEMFEFDDPRCEALRRRHLAHALIGRAAGRIHDHALEQAKSDLDRAALVHESGSSSTIRLLRTATNTDLTGSVARTMLRLRRRSKAVSGVVRRQIGYR